MEVSQREFERILKKIGDIASPPWVVQMINRVVADDSSTSETMGNIISKDQALTVKVLRLANSSYYGLSKKVDTISRAVTILGFNAVSNLALTVSVFKLFQTGQSNSQFDFMGLWKHCLACGIGAKVLMCKFSRVEAEKAFICGVIHDLGHVIIQMAFRDRQEKLFTIINNKAEMDIVAAEKEIIGFAHNDAGAAVAEMWHFPEEIVHAIKNHHYMRGAVQRETSLSVLMANEIVKALGLGKSVCPLVYDVEDRAWKMLGFRPEHLPYIVSEIKKSFDESVEFMQID